MNWFGLSQTETFILGIAALWIFSAAVAALEPPTDQSGPFYKWTYKFLKTIAGDLTITFGKYLPGAAKVVLLFVLLFTPSLYAQLQPIGPALPVTPVQNFYAGGVSYNNGASPAVAGTGIQAHLLSTETNTYQFGVIDILPNTIKPLTVTTNIGVGVAQKLFTIGSIDVFVPTSAGITINGQNTGWNWTTGALVPIKIKGNWYLDPAVRVVKSSVSNGTGYQLVPGLYVGWGK